MAPDSVSKMPVGDAGSSCAASRIELEHDPKKQTLGRRPERVVPVFRRTPSHLILKVSSDPEVHLLLKSSDPEVMALQATAQFSLREPLRNNSDGHRLFRLHRPPGNILRRNHPAILS